MFITARIAYIRFLYRSVHIWFSYISSHHSPNWHRVIEIFHSLIFVFTNKLGKEEAFISLFYEWDKASLHEGPHNSRFDTSVSSPTGKVRGFQQREQRGGLPRALYWWWLVPALRLTSPDSPHIFLRAEKHASCSVNHESLLASYNKVNEEWNPERRISVRPDVPPL